jgi:hypothetical protein
MGGRRARSLSEIVGAGLAPQRASFTRAIGQENAEGVATSSAKLVAKSPKIADILYYVSKLTDFVRKAVESEQDLNYEQRQQLARQEWSRIKREENLGNDPIVTSAIVSAVTRAIAKGRK